MVIVIVVIVVILLIVMMGSSTSQEGGTSSSAASLEVQEKVYVPFVAGTQTATTFDTDGGGNAIYLDRHNINCNGKALNQLRLNRNPANLSQYQFQYTCADGGELGPSVKRTTPMNDYGGGNTIYLDRHDAKCDENEVMTSIQLKRSADGRQWQWEYGCAPSKQTQPLTCRKDETKMNYYGGGNAIYLDRHQVQCKPNESLKQLRLNRDGGANYQFQYECCS